MDLKNLWDKKGNSMSKGNYISNFSQTFTMERYCQKKKNPENFESELTPYGFGVTKFTRFDYNCFSGQKSAILNLRFFNNLWS